ncbi:MAG TPA: type II toxin-antitoxin system VapC family toxin [Thermoanaerobaculia bacterium]|nr:type II toxin-antitoxin system VapC family toxin [Thermoanaerobaculia bacterium]
MRRTVYVETSVISYLAARPTRDLIVAARQQVTHDWWQWRRRDLDLYVSQVVLDEILVGDSEAVERRVNFVAGLPFLDFPPEVADLAAGLIEHLRLPPRAKADAAHIALAAFHGIDFLLTWNCTHIANAELRPRVEQTCQNYGYPAPILCTPDELMGEEDERRTTW